MQQKQTHSENNQSIKFYKQSNQHEYIFFRQTLPQNILNSLHQPTNQINQRRFQILYKQMLNEYCKKEKQPYMYKDIEQLNIILQNITCFSGKMFSGQVFCDMQRQISILLNLNLLGNICFRNLRILNLRNCGLTNIQALSWLNIGKIQNLQLDFNEIIYLNSLNKTSFPKMVCFTIIGSNQGILSYHSFSSLQRMHSPELHILHVNYQHHYYDNGMLDARFIVKLQISPDKQDKKARITIYCDQLNGGESGNRFIRQINYWSPFQIHQS